MANASRSNVGTSGAVVPVVIPTELAQRFFDLRGGGLAKLIY